MAPFILIVDDDPAVASGLATLLAQAGYRTRSAHTAAQAQQLLAAEPADLLVLDVMLPDMDGFTFCRKVRQLTPYVPILMLTARDELADKVLGLELGADEYVTKPFEPRELVARVRAILRLAEQRGVGRRPDEQVLVCGPVKLWKEQHRVEIHNQTIDLTPREWTLLEALMEHPGQVLGRETLLRRVWGYDFLGDSRAVDVHVQRLRAKLEPDPAKPRYIETVRSFGYRFTPQDEAVAPMR